MSIFMQISGIKGETSDKNHKGWIDAIEMDFKVNRKITSNTSTKGNRESSNATISNLRLMKLMDKTSPHLFLLSCCGTGKTIKIVNTKTGKGDGSEVFVEYTLENALFSKMQVDASNDAGFRPVEEYEISFTKLTIKYIPFDDDGNTEAPLIVGFDTETNTKT